MKLRDLLTEKGKLSYADALRLMLKITQCARALCTKGTCALDLDAKSIELDSREAVVVRSLRLITSAQDVVGFPIVNVDMHCDQGCKDTPEVNYSQKTIAFRLGTLLFEMLVGTHPFPGSLALIKQTLIQGERLNPPTPNIASFRSDCPKSIQALLQKALASNPEGRFETVEDILTALESCYREI